MINKTATFRPFGATGFAPYELNCDVANDSIEYFVFFSKCYSFVKGLIIIGNE